MKERLNEEVFQLQSKICKAISHPTRLKILHLLRDKELSVSELSNKLDLDQSNVSQHLRILRSTNLVESRKEGLNVYYKIYNKKISEACDLIRNVLKEIQENKSVVLKE